MEIRPDYVERLEALREASEQTAPTEWLVESFGRQIRWTDTIELRHIQDRFWKSEQGTKFSRILTETGWESSDGTEDKPTPEWMAQAMRTTFAQAESTWIGAEMLDLIEEASSSLPEDTTLDMEDLAFGAGFAVLERPVIAVTQDGRFVPLDALSWTPAIDKATEQHGLSLAAFAFYWHSPAWWDSSIETERERRSGKAIRWEYPDLLAVHLGTFIPFGDRWDDQFDRIGLRFAVTLLTLMGQPIAEIDERNAPREIRRRMEREGEDVSPVSVLTLRRPRHESEPPDGYSKEWSHRWVVGSHWRRQWYPSIQRHRSILINAYVKGPDDKPLVIKDRVYRWVR